MADGDGQARLRRVSAEQLTDRELLAVLDRARRISTPKPDWYLTLGHNPEMAVAYARYWDLTHRGGKVEHTIKELMRIAVSTLLGCEFCAEQRSAVALEHGLDEDTARACALPDFDHRDPRTRAALRFVRALVLDTPTDPVRWDPVYEDLRSCFAEEEIVELGCFAAIAIGGVKLSRSLNEPDPLPDGGS